MHRVSSTIAASGSCIGTEAKPESDRDASQRSPPIGVVRLSGDIGCLFGIGNALHRRVV